METHYTAQSRDASHQSGSGVRLSGQSWWLLVPHGVGDVILLQLPVERGLADAEQARGLELVAVQGADGFQDRFALHLRQSGYSRHAAFAVSRRRRGQPARVEAQLLQLRGQIAELQHRTGRERAGALQRMLEFAHIAW